LLTRPADDGSLRSSAERDRRALWRASLRRALRRGDVLGAARAWERLRVSGAAVTPEEAEAARSARNAVGHAIRDARWRRTQDLRVGIPVADGLSIALPLLRQPSRKGLRVLLLALIGAGLLAIGLYVLRPGASPVPGVPVLGIEEPGTVEEEVTSDGGRGRTSATIAPQQRATPRPTQRPRRTARPAPTGAPQAGSGGEGGIGAGPPAIETATGRFLFTVVDAKTGKPVADACVIFGTPDCEPERVHTNSLGLWWLDFDLKNPPASLWDFQFEKDGYEAQRIRVEYKSGSVNKYVIELVPTGG